MPRALIAAALAFLPACVAFSQSTVAAPPEFDVASIKPNTSGGAKQGKGTFLPGEVSFPNGTLKHLIMTAFQVGSEMVEGGPDWVDADRFDILAKAAPGTDPNTLRAMLQTLLAERFKLVTHRKDRTMPEYALTVVKSGAKLVPSPQPGERTCVWQNVEHGLRRRVCHNMTMAELAGALPGWGGIGVDRPVIDLTGLKGTYDFQFEVGQGKRGAGDGKEGAAVKDDSGPTIFEALSQLGLKLESRKGPVSTIVIDHAEKPTQNLASIQLPVLRRL